MVRSLADRTFQLRLPGCTWCAVGTFSAAAGASDPGVCAACPAGFSTLNNGAVECTSTWVVLGLVEGFDIDPYSDFSAK